MTVHCWGLPASTVCCCLFFFNDTATTEIYTLSLHDALPISLWHPEWPSPKNPGSLGAELVRHTEEIRVHLRNPPNPRKAVAVGRSLISPTFVPNRAAYAGAANARTAALSPDRDPPRPGT